MYHTSQQNTNNNTFPTTFEVENISQTKRGNTFLTHWKINKKQPIQFTNFSPSTFKAHQESEQHKKATKKKNKKNRKRSPPLEDQEISSARKRSHHELDDYQINQLAQLAQQQPRKDERKVYRRRGSGYTGRFSEPNLNLSIKDREILRRKYLESTSDHISQQKLKHGGGGAGYNVNIKYARKTSIEDLTKNFHSKLNHGNQGGINGGKYDKLFVDKRFLIEKNVKPKRNDTYRTYQPPPSASSKRPTLQQQQRGNYERNYGKDNIRFNLKDDFIEEPTTNNNPTTSTNNYYHHQQQQQQQEIPQPYSQYNNNSERFYSISGDLEKREKEFNSRFKIDDDEFSLNDNQLNEGHKNNNNKNDNQLNEGHKNNNNKNDNSNSNSDMKEDIFGSGSGTVYDLIDDNSLHDARNGSFSRRLRRKLSTTESVRFERRMSLPHFGDILRPEEKQESPSLLHLPPLLNISPQEKSIFDNNNHGNYPYAKRRNSLFIQSDKTTHGGGGGSTENLERSQKWIHQENSDEFGVSEMNKRRDGKSPNNKMSITHFLN